MQHGAALGSVIGVYGSAYGVTGFPGFLITTYCTLQYAIMLAVAAVPSEDIPDETFAAGVLGRGVGINPDAGIIVAPFDGEISSVAETHHAVGVTSPDGIELLIHVGADTVAMNGDGFECLVQEGQRVKAGDKLILFDREKIAAANHPDCVVVPVTNADDFDNLAIQTGPCKILSSVITV